MLYPYVNLAVATPENTVALQANVTAVVNAINGHRVIPYGDYGGPNVYYFTTMNNGLGNLIYTVFDKGSKLGLASFMVRYGSAATIQQVLFMPFPRSEMVLQFLILPELAIRSQSGGTVIP